MIIKWMTTKARQFLPLQDAGFDELNVSFDFALSPEIMNLLFAQNDDCMDAGGRAMHGAIAGTGRQTEDANATAVTQFALDEYELALT